ncbi:MAG: hypothetical protein AB8H79_24120 [Myxococcota bacterium]
MRRIVRALTLAGVALGLAAVPGCGVDPAKVPTHEVFAKDGETAKRKKSVSFAVVGATRSVAYGAKAEPKAPLDIISDIRSQTAVRGLDFVVLTGGYVRRSTPDEWNRFGRRWQDVLQSNLSSKNKGRKPVIAMPGDGEILGDKRLNGYGGAFPGTGTSIGFNRNASWGKADIQLGKVTWRIVVVDTHQRAMGSRWQEQMFWLPKAVSEGKYDKLIVLMPDPRVTLADGANMDPGDGPTQLIETIEEYAPMSALVAVISGGPATNEIILPSGAYGEAYVVAGNAGVNMPTLLQAGPADDAGYKDVGLEPLYTVALMQEFDRRSESEGYSEAVIDKAKGRGNWETYTPRFDGSAFAVQGWWVVDLEGESIALTFRVRRPDGTLADLYKTKRGARGGWKLQPVSAP